MPQNLKLLAFHLATSGLLLAHPSAAADATFPRSIGLLGPSTEQLRTVFDDRALEPLADLVASTESDPAGGFNAANNGRAMDLGKNGLIKVTGRDCSEVTIGEVMMLQQQKRLHAVGRYQLIGSTMELAVRWAGLSGSNMFTPDNQDRLFKALVQMKRPMVWGYITREHDDVEKAINGLAAEWAGMPTASGRTFYPNGNRAHASPMTVEEVLGMSRSLYFNS